MTVNVKLLYRNFTGAFEETLQGDPSCRGAVQAQRGGLGSFAHSAAAAGTRAQQPWLAEWLNLLPNLCTLLGLPYVLCVFFLFTFKQQFYPLLHQFLA